MVLSENPVKWQCNQKIILKKPGTEIVMKKILIGLVLAVVLIGAAIGFLVSRADEIFRRTVEEIVRQTVEKLVGSWELS